ncbi:PTS IIA-like nitrogen regulatory protein PtsN [Gynuella sunshinyii]|uniref:Phosphotransferase system mannitol/fructose-specific IIA domain (Ntr-type) n=1 Tax=Gynuella sunshinyii YC6258 TaxID=1445510 RepID=A0A0C5VQG8_9GAMM|nr:PTS IIA-like nitrogen regulatory protein PtsN [Gynuella sunshinyii]AJQ96511.1 phosphotransferase system mannitol/fructose-specific IIA domain (Ntr-type) [Gynuella sunshinyii YC6258]
MLNQILQPGYVFTDVAATSKKKALQDIAEIISQLVPELTSDYIFDNLIARERLGSTGFGNGVAIPHCRISNYDKIIGAFFRLKDAIDFDAVDKRPVNLLFVLLVPEEEKTAHLEVLSLLSEKFSNETIRNKLATMSKEDIYQLFINP